MNIIEIGHQIHNAYIVFKKSILEFYPGASQSVIEDQFCVYLKCEYGIMLGNDETLFEAQIIDQRRFLLFQMKYGESDAR